MAHQQLEILKAALDEPARVEKLAEKIKAVRSKPLPRSKLLKYADGMEYWPQPTG